MIFPTLKDKVFGYVNLNSEAEWWMHQHPSFSSDALVDPQISTQMVNGVNRKYHLDFSYGGWMEDRRFLWKGTYLEPLGTYIHLGVDINVPAGTEIAADFDCKVVKVDDDYPEEGGWGSRVIVKHHTEPVYMVYAHLGRDIRFKEGDALTKGAVFASVGHAPYNGNWFPHVHVQTIRSEYYDELVDKGLFDEFDGYGTIGDVSKDSYRFPDPLQFIRLI